MSRFDRYFFWQLLLLFAFFSLILVGVLWITRSVSLLDKLIADGQSALVFLEFTALTLPSLIQTVVPISVFSAALYVTNRLNRESELTAMLATGASPWRLARAVIAFGIATGLMMAILSNVLRPASLSQLEIREAELSSDVTAGLLQEGSFLHPIEGVTLFIRDIGKDGVLHDVFLSDQRTPGFQTTNLSARAFVVREGERTNLIFLDGMALRRDEAANTLSSTLFDDFSFDLESMLPNEQQFGHSIRAISSRALIQDRAKLRETRGFTDGELTVELHERIAWSTICVAVALIGFATLMLGGFSRFGLWPQLLLAFLLLIVLEGLRGALSPAVLERPSVWPVLYLPTVIGLGLSVVFLRFAGRPLRVVLGLKRADPEAEGA